MIPKCRSVVVVVAVAAVVAVVVAVVAVVAVYVFLFFLLLQQKGTSATRWDAEATARYKESAKAAQEEHRQRLVKTRQRW